MSTVTTHSDKKEIIYKYLETNDPHKKPDTLSISIRNVLEYAKEIGKDVTDLTEDEVARFNVK